MIMKIEYYKKNTYNIYQDDGSEYIIPLTEVLAPFGEEEFKKKIILNFEKDVKKNNDSYNIIAYLENVELELLQLDIFKNMENKSPLKKRYPKKPLLRVHINDDAITFIKKGEYTGNFKIDKVWKWRNTYGVYLSLICN